MIKKSFIIIVLLCGVSIAGFSQEPKKWKHSYTYRHFGMREGLGQSQVLKTFQDSFGYMWFATYNGISRFDGLNFNNFSLEDLQIPSGARIFYFNQYHSALLVASVNGIKFVYPDQTIENYPLTDIVLSSSTDFILIDDYIYLFNCQTTTQSNVNNFLLVRFDLKNKTYKQIAENLPQLSANVLDGKIFAITNNNIINSQITIYHIDNEQIKVIQTMPCEKNYLLLHTLITAQNEWFIVFSKEDAHNPIHDLYQFNIENDSAILICKIKDLPSKYFLGSISILRWDENHLLVGKTSSSSTIIMLNTDDWSLTDFPLDMLQINQILQDSDKNLWFATEEGVFYCSRFFFESYQLCFARFDNIWGAIKDLQGNVWFSSYNFGFWRADSQGCLFLPKIISNSQKNNSNIVGYMGNCRDNRGRIFQSCGYGIVIYDPKYGDPNRLELVKTGVSLAIYFDQENGKTYFGGQTSENRTINVMDINGEVSSYYAGVQYIISICRDGNRKLRIGYFRGESWFDEENKIVIKDTVQRPYSGIISMDLDEKGILWKGTTNGLFAENKQGDNQQVSDKMTSFVVNYRNQYIIWGEKDKLLLLDLKAYHSDGTLNIRSFGYFDGYDLMESGQNGASIDAEGYVWVTGADKVIRFLPEQIMQIPILQPQTPTIGAIYNANKNSEWTLVKTLYPCVFDNKDNFLRFDLLQASVSAPDKLVFRYRLEGYTELWTTTNERSIVFQNLPYGRYRFEVQSSFDNGVQWSESVFSTPVTIRKTFWMSFTGLLLIFIALAMVIFAIIYFTRKIILHKEEEKRQIDQLRHRAVQAKFIPHFTGNVLNSINFLINKDPHSAQLYVSKFSDFSNQTLRNSDKLTRTLQEELNYSQLFLEFEKLRFEEKLDYTISVAPEVDMQIMIPTMILQTFCENAIKHGLRPKPKGGKIEINIYRKEEYEVISVRDNGVGRAKALQLQTEGTKEGLKIVNQQLELFNKRKNKAAYLNIVDLSDENGQPAGTCFELFVAG